MALTAIDTFSNLSEIIQINNKTSRHVADQFTNLWLFGIQNQIDAYPTMEENSLDTSSNPCWPMLGLIM